MSKRLLFSSLLISSSAFALAFGPTGPFVGSLNEDFESFNNYANGGIFSAGALFGGAATFASSAGTDVLWIYQPVSAGWGLGGNGNAIANGAKGGGLFSTNNNQSFNMTFTSPVTEFGGWFATVNLNFPDVPLTFAFFDGANNFLGNDSVDTPSSAFVWKGWTHAAGIGRVEMRGNLAPVMDDLQINPIPEPATMFAAGLGLLAIARKRKAKKA